MKKKIMYFDKTGPSGTDETLLLSKKRADEIGIRDIIIASNHGSTGLKATKIFDTSKYNIIVVTICEGFKSEGWAMTNQEREQLIEKGMKVFTGIHALGDDVSSAFTAKFGGRSFNEIVAQTLYRFSQGMKVCVEIILMATDAGLVPANKEVIAIAGTGGGADTAIVAESTYPRKFLEMKILEIISKPREG
jgi:hypothetical protein